MVMKGMELGLKVLVAVICILVVAIVVLGIFTGGAQQVGQKVGQWIEGVPEEPKECSAFRGSGECTMFKGCHCCPPDTCTICKPLSEKCL